MLGAKITTKLSVPTGLKDKKLPIFHKQISQMALNLIYLTLKSI